MRFQEDPNIFFYDFGLSFVAGAVSGQCILEEPGQMLFNEGVVSEDYTVLARQDLFGHLRYTDLVSVDNIAYTVKDSRPFSDGVFCLIRLEKLEGNQPLTVVFDGDIF